MARHKLTPKERLKGMRALLRSKKVNKGLKKYAREYIKKHG